MSTKYKFHNPEGIYFVTFATVDWVNVFTRTEYKTIVVDSLKYCQTNKGLEIFSWCLMSNHLHIIVRANQNNQLSDILRDLKKFTSQQIIKAIHDHPQESRKDWMLDIFKQAGTANSNNKNFQFWRQDNHPIELYSSAVIEQKLDYVHSNPVAEGMVYRPEGYIYSSAIDYAGGKGLIDVSFM